MTTALPPLSALKDQARRLRTALGDSDQSISHCRALEMIAKQHGFRDWNTLAARASAAPETTPPAVGDTVKGEYLGQPFRGQIKGVESLAQSNLFRIAVEFDDAVDVVTFDSFSAMRKRVSCVIDKSGVSPSKRSDGVPHMRISH